MGQREASIPPAAKEAAEKGLHRFEAAENVPRGLKPALILLEGCTG
jgi:hypothetical protein